MSVQGGGASNVKHDSSASDGAKTVENDGDSTSFGVDTLPAYSEAASPVAGAAASRYYQRTQQDAFKSGFFSPI